MQKSEYKNIYENENAHFYYLGMHYLVINLLKKYSPKKKLKILDAGCGTGLLIKKLDKFGEVWGVDINVDAIKFAKSRGIKNLKKSSVTKLPFKDKYFDILISIDVLYHKWIKDDQKALKEFYRVLKPNGVLILKLPANEWLRGSHDITVMTRERYTKKSLESKLKKNKFQILRISYFYFFALPLVLFSRMLETFQKKASQSDIKRIPRVLNNLLFYITKIEANLWFFLNLPTGVSLIAVAKKSNFN